MKIERALESDAKELTELTIRSKDHWNYGKQQIEAWVEELTIRPEYIATNRVYKLTLDCKTIAFYAFLSETPIQVKLSFLFIDPIYIGKGYGKILMVDLLQRARSLGYTSITLDSDPHAENFYKRFGFKRVGKLKSSIEGRFLPIMELNLS